MMMLSLQSAVFGGVAWTTRSGCKAATLAAAVMIEKQAAGGLDKPTHHFTNIHTNFT
jgi:hypothetical protein